MPDPTPIYVEAETNVIGKAQMSKVREVDFAERFSHGSLKKLIEVLGVTRKLPMQEGTTLYMYTTTGTLQSGAVAEGEVIPLSKYQRDKAAVGEMTLEKWRKATTAEAIMKSGYDEAVAETDENDTAAAVYFVNPVDVGDYLASAQITVQNAFGMNYIEDFLGLGTVILSSQITAGTFLATAKENIVLYYLTMNGDIAGKFGLTVDDLGLIGIKTDIPTENRAQLETLVMSGVTFFIEYDAGVVKGTISDSD